MENKVDLCNEAKLKGLFKKKYISGEEFGDFFSFRRGVWLMYFLCVGGEQQLMAKR